MESPYSQSLHGMIKDIETVTIKRKVPDDTSMMRSSSHQPLRHSHKRIETQPEPAGNAYLTSSIKLVSSLERLRQSANSSRRNLKVAADVYGFKVSHGKLS